MATTTAPASAPGASPAALTAAEKERERNRRKKERKRAAKQEARELVSEQAKDTARPDVIVEYVAEEIGLAADPQFAAMSAAFSRFLPSLPTEIVDADGNAEAATEDGGETTVADDGDEEDAASKFSKKKMRRAKRQTVAEIKRLVKRPDVVEWVDATAADPGLLIELKAAKNTVPVPRHWSQKRKYLQGKRGIEKPPFELPEFIKKTGITEMRQTARDKEDSQTAAQRSRARVQVKLGRIEIDYEKLHDAFFRWQTKPTLTQHGEMYYEGKEFEVRVKEKRPGMLSEELRAALNMPTNAPPPWLINMQRYGPPPAYPNLKIPGLNAPIPPGAQWGFHPGGWGKPPVDEFGQPIYGDVFGTAAPPPPPEHAEPIERAPWGEMEADEEEEQPEEGAERRSDVIESYGDGDEGEQEDAEQRLGQEDEEDDMASLHAALDEGLATPVVPLVVPASISKRSTGGSVLGSGASGVATGGEGVTVTLDVSDIGGELDQAKLKAMLADKKAEDAPVAREDLSDMVAEHEAKQSKKRKKVDTKSSGGPSKKAKEFKF